MSGDFMDQNGTHTMRRTKATLIYRKTKNLCAVQLLLGHTKLESTVKYVGIEVDDEATYLDALKKHGSPLVTSSGQTANSP
jgi:site-specific recombinase XerC